MLVGVVAGFSVKPLDPDDPIKLIPSCSVDTLLPDVAVGRCDVVVLPQDQWKTSLEALFAAACLRHPASSVWVAEGGSSTLRCICSGRYGVGPRHWGSAALPEASLLAVRQVWLGAWADWVGAAVQEANGIAVHRELPARCFLHALGGGRASDLSAAVGRGARDVEKRLASLGLRGPKRFLMAARVFSLWELARIDRWSMEHVAVRRLGFATRWSMDHSVVSAVGLPPREVAQLTDWELLDLLVRALRRALLTKKRTFGRKSSTYSDAPARTFRQVT